jgi:hypothetical protein
MMFFQSGELFARSQTTPRFHGAKLLPDDGPGATDAAKMPAQRGELL